MIITLNILCLTYPSGMSNILCALASVMSGCRDIFVFVLQPAVLRSADIACFAFGMYYYIFYNYICKIFITS